MSEPRWAISRARGVWEEGARTGVRVRQFPIVVDEPELFGGTNQGPRPTEYLLAAYCGCTVVIAERAARELGLELNRLEVEARGMLDQRGVSGEDGADPCFQRVEGTVSIGFNGTAEDLWQLRTLVERRCPLHNTLARSGAQMLIEWSQVEEGSPE